MASQTRIQFVDSVINAMVDNSRYPQIAGQPMPDAMRSEMENSMARLANPIYDCITSFVYDSPGVFPDERVKANALDPTTGYLGDKIDNKTLKLDETTFKIYVDTVPVAESAKLGGIMIGSQPYLFMTSNNISLNVDTTNDLSGGADKVPTSRAVKLYLGNVIDGITSGVGNMFKATYDVNDTGVVDDSERLNNQLPSYYLNYNNLSNRPTDAPSDGIMYARKDASWISLLTNFYTETEIDDLLTYKANATHLHTESDISDLKSYIEHATSDGNYYSSRNGVWESFTPNIVQDLSGLVPYTGATTDVSLGAHNLIVDTDTLFINSIGHYVGIGIATPTSKLHVAGKQILSYGVPSGALSIGADVNLTTRSTNVRKLGVIAGIDYTNTKNIELFTTDSVSTVSNLVYFGGRNGGSSYAATHIYFTTAPNTSTTGGTTRMFINNSGRVGINTVSPASLLTIIGSSGTITDGLTFNTAGTIGIYIDGSNNLTFTDTVTGTKTLAELLGASLLETQKFKLSSLNTAPSSSTDTGILGEIRITADYIYVCTATNTWKRTALTTW